MERSEIRNGHSYRTKSGYVLHVDSREYLEVRYHCEGGPHGEMLGKGGKITVDEFLERVVAEVPQERVPCR